jgi:hypothetical protein
MTRTAGIESITDLIQALSTAIVEGRVTTWRSEHWVLD